MFWTQAKIVAKAALNSGELLPIATHPQIILQQDVQFRVHIKNDNMLQKISEAKTSNNPFLPYEKSMYVADSGDSHVCLLNRYPVLDNHLLICTRHFEAQSAPLNLANFEAWLAGFNEPDVFGFYNGGREAGASQAHRHMQLLRMTLPLEALILSGKLPFQHRFLKLDSLEPNRLYQAYLQLMEELELIAGQECLPYNLLIKSDWMLLIPRRQKSIENVFLNGLNYAGVFLLRNNAQLEWAKNYGLLKILNDCAL